MLSNQEKLNTKLSSYKDKIRVQLKKKLFNIKNDTANKAISNDYSIETPYLKSEIENSDFTDFYVIQEKLGEGAHALVHKAIRKKDNAIFAVKIFRTNDPEIIATIRKTYQIGQLLQHPNLIQVKELYINEQNGYTYQIMELCQYPSLESIISKLSEDQIRLVIKGILEGLTYMHKVGVCHRDLKPDNILFNGQQIKIIDFGVSKRFVVKLKPIDMWTSTGTSFYCAPEIYMGIGYTYKIDMWAVGVIMYQCLTHKLPFYDDTVYGTIDLICQCRIPEHPAIKDNLIKDLLQRLMNPDPKKRLNALDALKHPWFNQKVKSTKCMDDVNVHDGLMNNSSLFCQMSQSSQREDLLPPQDVKVEAFKQTIHVRQKSFNQLQQ